MNKSSSQTVVRLFHMRWFYVVNFVLILIVIFSFTHEMIRSHDISTQIQALKKQSQELQTQHLAIADLKNAVQTESYVENEARLKLGLKKPGESLIILKNEKSSDAQNPSNADARQQGLGEQAGLGQKPLANSSKWWYYFFNKKAYRDDQSL